MQIHTCTDVCFAGSDARADVLSQKYISWESNPKLRRDSESPKPQSYRRLTST